MLKKILSIFIVLVGIAVLVFGVLTMTGTNEELQFDASVPQAR